MHSFILEKVEKFTLNFNNDVDEQPTEIIIVPTGSDINRGFGIAKNLLSQNLKVRIIGDGVTMPTGHPAWVYETKNLWLTELGAYETEKILETKQIFGKEIKAWLRHLLGEIIPGYDSGELFYGSAVYRFLNGKGLSGGIPTLHEIIAFNGAKNYYYLEDELTNLWQFKHLVEYFGGTLNYPKSLHSWGKLKILILGFSMMLVVLFRQIGFYLREKPSRTELRRIRKHDRSKRKTLTWTALAADWERMNLPIINSVALPVLERGESLGILLVGRLVPGKRLELNHKNSGRELWSGLNKLKEYLPNCQIDQVATVESLTEFFRVVLKFVKKSSRIIIRAAVNSRKSKQKLLNIDFAAYSLDSAKLITHDIFMALLGEKATNEVISRYDFKESQVFASLSGLMPYAATDIMLQRAGATTIDFQHGVPQLWKGLVPTPSSVRQVFVKPELLPNPNPEQRVIVSETPVLTSANSDRNRGKARNILVLTSYIYGDWAFKNSFRPFHDELIDVIPTVRELFPGRFQFRWRPHPMYPGKAINETLEKIEDVELSKQTTLDEDLTWGDIVITNFSTVLADALQFDVPIFLHVLPSDDFPSALCFAPSRRFFRCSEIRLPFVECVNKLDSGDSEALIFERQTREAWFGNPE